MKKKPYRKRINGFWVYSKKKMKPEDTTRKPSLLLDALDRMEAGQYMTVPLERAKLIRAMVQRRKYTVRQTKIRAGQYQMEKVEI